MSSSEVIIYMNEHPYYSAGGAILALFIIGFFFSVIGTVWTGARVVGNAGYYLTYPLHAPIRWGYRRINESS